MIPKWMKRQRTNAVVLTKLLTQKSHYDNSTYKV